MSESSKLDFHFIDLKGELTGEQQKPACATEHRSLSINKSAVLTLIATRESPNIGAPLPSSSPPLQSEPPHAEEPPARIDSRALGVDFSLPQSAISAEAEESVEPLPEANHEQEPSEPAPPPEETEQTPVQDIASPVTVPEPRADLDDALETRDLQRLSAEVAAQAPALPDSEPPTLSDPVVEIRPVEEHEPPSALPTLGADTDGVLSDVQHTLDALAEMAKGLTLQKLEAVKQQETLDQRKSQLYEKERLLADKEEQLRLLETRLTREVSNLERNAEDNARALAERSAALKALAENVEARDRSTAKLAESLRLEKQRNDELAESLLRRTESLDEREASLNRKDDDLAEKLKQLVGAKDRFRNLVKTFNETVQFNNTLNAISSTAMDD
ncbi:hypothetical protein [Pseudomonas sp. TCU-HL1]|uniref:hypothetical protein n=1 Tax=Pseudomonas sp. TCU-HL1 TaxID=1856685 RepID=UPI00083D69FB|nr:hypothetical protein [Pseudomonas sp. TCU-HL1]AOE87139.1 hypothetical protein THL1_4591 [Pseudomonas sp. TCU-HL1]